MNPLSFSVGVKDEASKQLEAINKELNNLVSKLDSIKNIAISLGGDPAEAESLMKSLNGVAASLANISKLSPEAQAASDRLTDSQQKLNAAMDEYNNLLAKIKAANPTQTFLDATKGLTGVGASGFAGGFKNLDPTEWAGFFKKFLVQASDLSAKDIEGNVNKIVANIRRALSESLSDVSRGKGYSFVSLLEEGFNFNSVNQKLNEAFAKLREEYIKGMKQLEETARNESDLKEKETKISGLTERVQAAQKEFEALKNATSSTPVNPEAFKGAEGAIAATNEATKMLGEAINKLDFTKINTALDQLAERLNKLVTELAGIEERMKTAFTGALEANVKSLGDVIDGLAKKISAMSTPMSEGMKQGEQATNAQTEAIKKQEDALVSIQKKLQRLQEIRDQAVSTISELRSSYGSRPNRDWWSIDSIRDAVAKDRKERESAIDALDKKWETYWRKQEQEAQKFANSLGKALKDVKWDDFEKHSSGALSDQAKSWYRVQMRELYDVQRMKEEVHKLKGYGDDQYREEIRVLEALIRKISQYENAKNKAFSASPNQDAAVSKVTADERAYYVAWGKLSAANKERRDLLAQEAEVQQRLNGLRSGAIDASAAKYEEQRLAITKQIEEAEKNIALAKERMAKADAQIARLNSGQMSAKEAATFIGQNTNVPADYRAFIESEQKRITALKQQLAELDEQKRQSATTTEKQTQSEQQQAQATKELGQNAGQTAEQLQKLAQSTVGEAFNQLAASLNKIKELFDNIGKAEGLTQLNNTINGVNTAVESLAKTLSNVNNAVKFTGSTEEIAAYEAKVKSLQEQVAALEAKAKGLGETAKAASEQVKTVTASGGGGSSKDGLTEAQLKKVNDQLEILQKRLNTIEPNYTKAKDLGFSDEVIQGKINHLHAYIDALNEAVKAGSYSGIKVGDYSIFSRAANEDVPTQAQAQKMAKQMQEYIAIQQQSQAEVERQAQAQERMRQAAEAAGMSIVKAGDQTQSAGQKSEGAKQQMHGFNEEILVNMRSWEKAGEMMAVLEKRIFAVMAQLQSGKSLGFDTGKLQSDIQELMRFYAIMKEIRNNYGFANIEGAMLTTSKVLKESGLDFGQIWEKNKQELTAVKTIYEQMTRLQALANNKNALPTDNLNTKYQMEALENALRAQDIMAKLKSVDLRQATALVGGQDYQQATAAIEAFFRTYNKNANIATSQTAELQRLLEKIQGTDKGGGWINVMKNAGVSEDKINEMRQIAEKIQRAIAALEQSRQMGTAANFVQSDWYRATVVEGKKANDTGYLAVREAHEQAAAEREIAKANQEAAKAAEKKREEMSKAWREQEAARQKEAAAVEASMQKQMAAEEKARQKSIEDAWKAADQVAKAKQQEAASAASSAAAKTKEEVKGYDEQIGKLYELERAMSKRFASEQEAQRQYNALLEQTKALKDRILAAEDKAKTVGADTSVLSGAWMKAYDFQQKLQGVSEKDQKTAYRVGALEEEYKKLAQALTQAAKEQEKLNAATEKKKKTDNDDRVKQLQREETNQRRVNAAYEEAQRLLSRLESTGMRGLSLGLDVAKIDDARSKLDEFINKLVAFDKYADNHATTELIGNFNILRRSLVETAKAQEQLNSAQERANKKAETKAEQQAAKDAREARQEQEKWAESMRRAGVEITNLDVLLRKLSATEKAGASLGIDTSRLRDQISLIQRYLRIIEGIASGGNRDWNAGAIMNGGDRIAGELGLPNAIKLANEAAAAINKETQEINKLNAEKQKATGTTSQLTAEEQRLAQALGQTTEHAKGQSQVLSDLKSMAMQYLGVWGGQQFLHNIIEIGGQLEMQRMSIGAILQNQSQANDLFEKIKGLAVQSPFGIVELDQMTKQLTAYGFKYSELFDMTKRLADISAATGTGVDRLALALGHVRSEAALSGYTLRQFSMGNVPLLAKLSEKLGKTTQEIRKMVRAKEISYEDVEGVIKDLTNEGGMFYNMQETISQSVKARFKNVKDAMAIMYGEMAESGIGDVLKSVADALMEVTNNWKDVATVMGAGVAVWATQRAAIIAYTALIGKETAATFASIGANVKKQGVMLQLANKYRVLTTAERDLLNASRANSVMIKLRTMLGMNYTKAQGEHIAAQRIIITNSLTQQLSEGKLTVAELSHMVATRKLTHEEARLIIMNSSLDASMKEQMLSIIGSTRQLSRLELAYHRVGMAMKSLMSSAAAFAPMVIISGLMELWQRNNQEMERAKDLGDAIFEASQDGLKNARMMMEETGINAYQQRNGKLVNLTSSYGAENENIAKTFLVKPEFDPSSAEQIIEKWTQFIKNYAGTPNKILNDALMDEEGNVRSLKEQFDNLYDSVVNVVNAQKELVELSWVFSAAQENTGDGMFKEDIVKNVKDYEAALKNFDKSVVRVFKDHGQAVKKGIDAARSLDANFAKATEGMGSYVDMLRVLVENNEDYEKASSTVRSNIGRSVWYNLLDDSEMADKARNTMKEDLKNFIGDIQATLTAAGKDPKNLDISTQQGLMQMFTTKFIGQLGNISEKTRKELVNKFASAFNIAVDDAEQVTAKRLMDWQRRASKIFEVNKAIKVKTDVVSDKDEFAQAVYKDIKEKEEYLTRETKPIKQLFRIKPEIKLDTDYLGKYINAIVNQIHKLTESGQTTAAGILMSQLYDELMPFYDAMKSLEEDKKWLKQEGYPEKDPTKDKSKNKKDTKKSYKDPVAEEWKERIRLLKDANQLYKEWNKRSGEDAALNRVREQYGDIFEKWRTDKNVPWADFKAEDIIEYRNYVQKIVDEAQKRYDAQRNDKAKNYGKEAEAVLREGKKLLDDIDRYDFDEKAREFKTAFDKALDDMTRRWEIFTSVRNATGNKLLAFDMAGIGQDSRNLRNAADALKDKLADEMQRVGGSELLAKIPFNIDIDEEKLRDQFKAILGDSEKYATTIDGLVDAYKRWQKLQQDVVKNDIDVFAKLMGSVVSYSAQIRKINDELAQQKTAIANSGASASQQQEATAIAESQADWKKMKLSADYSNLYNKTIAMSRTEFENAAEAVQRMIDKLRDLGAISPDEYLQEVDKLNKARMEWTTNGFLGERGAFGNFISGGNQGLMDYYQRRADKARRDAEDLRGKGQDATDAEKEAKHYQKLYEALKKLTDEAQDVVNAFQTLQSGLSLLENLFDSLGMEGAASAMSDAGGILGGALQGASSLSALGPYGMAAGAAIGVIGGIAQVHDKALERHINKLRDDVKGIEHNTELIAKSRERTLGYDMGDVRRSMAQQYATQSYGGSGIMAYINAILNGSQQNKSMYEYYSKNSQGTGYQQEYDNLIEQRKKYLEILQDQQDKKKKSNDEIEETKAKIAELDDQIAYFSQDLAKELWSIDIKGWADQLSDALASAFENGENMAKSYRDTVTQIIQQMMQKMMQMAILEPMFERLQKQLFGENGKGGVFDPNNPKGSMSKVTKIIGDYFGKGGEGEKAITASMEFMTAFQRGMQNAGLTVLNEASNTLSSGIQGTSEETSGLLAGYVNALRQDVSVNRILLTQFVSQMWPDYMETFANQVTAVQNIDSNVQVIMMMMQTGSGAMYDEIAALRARIDNVVLGIDKFSIR